MITVKVGYILDERNKNVAYYFFDDIEIHSLVERTIINNFISKHLGCANTAFSLNGHYYNIDVWTHEFDVDLVKGITDIRKL